MYTFVYRKTFILEKCDWTDYVEKYNLFLKIKESGLKYDIAGSFFGQIKM